MEITPRANKSLTVEEKDFNRMYEKLSRVYESIIVMDEKEHEERIEEMKNLYMGRVAQINIVLV